MEAQQEALREAWLNGRDGNLNARSEAKAWALREVWRNDKETDWGLQSFVASCLKKIGGGTPTQGAISKLFAKIDDDPEWFPGKSSQRTFGVKPALSAQAKQAIARSAMAMKGRKHEPTYRRIIGACPQAVLNPATGKPVGAKRVYDVFRELCYDNDPEELWTHQTRLSKTALTDEQIAKRYKWSTVVSDLGHSAHWYYHRVVWSDLCNSILPLSEKKADEQALARKGIKGWSSDDSKLFSQNLKGKKEALKQKSWDTVRVWWAPILSRGKLHIEVFDEDFPGEVPAGARVLVEKVRAALNIRFHSDQPTTLYVDRGKGFFDAGTGKITGEFKAALRYNGLKAFWGEDASAQPGNLQEIHLHETAVSWIRRRLTASIPCSASQETRVEYVARLKAVCADINHSLDVEGLCRAFPARVQGVKAALGDRIAK